MATLLEEFNNMKAKVAAAQAKGDMAALNRKIHIIDHEKERNRKIRNPQRSKRIVFNCRTADAYCKFQIERERFFEIAVDPHIAIDLITRAMHEVSDATILQWIREGEMPVEKPDWMR